MHYYAVEQSIDPLALTLENTIEVAHAHGVLVTVDAAGQIYPLENFGKYVRMGADFQCIAAKYLGATQSVGLALGSEEMIRKIGLQAFASYEAAGCVAWAGPRRSTARRWSARWPRSSIG